MASIINRSRYTVTVPNRARSQGKSLTRTFPYSKRADAEAYMNALIEQGLTPDITQGTDTFQVKIVRVGRKDLIETFHSLAEAEAFIRRVESEQHQGLFRDYTKAAHTTTAELIKRYMEEDCPGLKGGDNYIIILNAMLQDSTHELRQRIAQRKAEIKEFGRALTPLGANRQPMTSLEWLQLPLTEVTPSHIEDFIADRMEYVAGATVDRQIDILSSIYTRARTGWRIHMDFSPLDGVKRPKYFNERDRRLKGDEEPRLLEAARKEDQMLSLEAHVEALAADEVAAARQLGTHYAVNQARKAAYDKARQRAITEGFPITPLMETFVQFQLATAARRGESLGLFWDRIDWEERTAFIPTTKNGRPRKLSVRSDILALLKRLPRSSDLVFDVGLKELQASWKRICEAAGIEDLRVHDLRHEAISRAAESGKFPTVLDLQAFSGHKEIRSLTRYTHLCAGAITRKLEEAEAARKEQLGNKGRLRLKQSDLHWLGSSACELNANVQARDQVTDAADIEGATRQESTDESKKPESGNAQGDRATNVIDLLAHRRG